MKDVAPDITLYADLMEAERMRQLWCAVLARALDDALGCQGDLNGNEDAAARRLQLAAADWFRHGGVQFRLVCWLAGLDPEVIQGRSMARIERRGPARDLRKHVLRRW